MAAFKVDDYIDIGCKGFFNAVSWQIALDPEFIQIIDETHKNTEAVDIWHSMLPKIGEDGYYADLDNIYARVKVWIDDNESEWFSNIPSKNQNDQTIVVVDVFGNETTYNSLIDGFN